jgi:xylulokinase
MIMVINVGLKNARCIIFGNEGNVAADYSNSLQTSINNDHVEQSPREWWSQTQFVTSKAVKSVGERARDIEHVTLTTSASCLVILDKNMKLLRDSILVSDTRAIKEAEMLGENVLFREIKKNNGIKSSPDLMIPKIMWLSKHEPHIFEKAKYFLNISDYLTFMLTGEFVTDKNNASKFHFQNDIGEYPYDLMHNLNIQGKEFSSVVPIGSVIGKILPSVAEDLGIPNSCKMVMATYDALSAVVGNGAFEVGDAVDVSGTVTSFRLVSSKKLRDPKDRIYVTPHLNDKDWLCGGSNNLGGGVIEWAKQLFFDNDPNAYEIMQLLVENSQACPGGLLFLPYLLGERTPLWNPDCRGTFFGVNRAHTKDDFIKSIFEGVGFSVLSIASVLRELGGSINKVIVAGGLSRIGIINQVKADMLNTKVLKYSNFETTAIGAALIAMVGVGKYNKIEEAFNAFCTLENVYEPNAVNARIYSNYFEIYMGVYNDLQQSFIGRARLLDKLKLEFIDELVIKEDL